jgi:hypothetical protein
LTSPVILSSGADPPSERVSSTRSTIDHPSSGR